MIIRFVGLVMIVYIIDGFLGCLVLLRLDVTIRFVVLIWIGVCIVYFVCVTLASVLFLCEFGLVWWL